MEVLKEKRLGLAFMGNPLDAGEDGFNFEKPALEGKPKRDAERRGCKSGLAFAPPNWSVPVHA